MDSKTNYYEKISKFRILKYFVIVSFTLIFKTIKFFSQIFFHSSDTIVVIALHKLGDTIFTFPAIKKIQNYYKKKEIYIICFRDSKCLFELIHPISKITVIPFEWFLFNQRVASSKARKTLRKLNPEIIIDLTGVMTSASLIFNSAAKEIIGFNREIFRGIFSRFATDKHIEHSSNIYLNAIEHMCLVESTSQYEVERNLTTDGPIIIHPSAGWKSKEWSLRKYIELYIRLSRDYNCYIIRQPNSTQYFLEKFIDNDILKIITTYSINELITLINSASLIIGNDSGPIQIAAVLGKPTFTIYGPTNPKYHLPNFNKELHKSIQKIIKCSPSIDERLCKTKGGTDGCPSFECMHLLSTDEVYVSVFDFIKELNIKKLKQ